MGQYPIGLQGMQHKEGMEIAPFPQKSEWKRLSSGEGSQKTDRAMCDPLLIKRI